MRQGQNGRRPRSRHHGGSGGNGGGGGNPAPMGGGNRPRSAASLRHQTFDSNCNDVRVRGNAWQVHEKYQALARDAQSAGDRVAAEHYFQHAEHYYRIIEAINEATAAEQRLRAPQQAFGGQPDVPSNYYGPDGAPLPQPQGNGMQQPQSGDLNGNMMQSPEGQPQAEAQVTMRTPPQSAFFAPEEMDDVGSGEQPMVVNR